MLLSNLSSLIKNQADEEIEISAKSSNKYRYQAKRAFIIGFMKRLLPKILCTISTIDEINRLYSEAVRNRSQIMPGRTFKRKKNKAKGRTHFNNQKVGIQSFLGSLLFRVFRSGSSVGSFSRVWF